MSEPARASERVRLSSSSGLCAEFNANGSLRRFDCGQVSLLLFPGSEMEGGLTNLYLRQPADPQQPAGPPRWMPLLGPRSATRGGVQHAPAQWCASGQWRGLRYELQLRLASSEAAWFWVVTVFNDTPSAQVLDLTYAQDLGLTTYGAARNNEYYCSQYIDHTPLSHATQGHLIGSRQNQAVDGRFPWTLIGSLRRADAFATDALQFHDRSARDAQVPPGLQSALPSRRLQHEHSMVALRGQPLPVQPGQSASCGFFGLFVADHREATTAADLARLSTVVALPEAALTAAPAVPATIGARAATASASLFVRAGALETLEPSQDELQQFCPGPWRHVERDAQGRVLSFFQGADRHVVVRSKELQVLRPHGQLLRTGRHQTPAETSLTSTVWMAGVFHSMVAQGHVNINRFLSTVRSYLGLFRAQGQRVFVELQGSWQLLQLPSLFEMAPHGCRWLYRHREGLIEVRSGAHSDPHALSLALQVLDGPAVRFLISHHVAFGGDDGAADARVQWQRDGQTIHLFPPEGSELARRFPGGSFGVWLSAGSVLERVGGDELLFADDSPRAQPYLCLLSAPTREFELQLRGDLVREETQSPLLAASATEQIPHVPIGLDTAGAGATPARLAAARTAARLGEMLPWFAQNAWVHFLSPRGLEQFSGGGWGTRDVCQGPVELLLALGHTAPVRDILLRVMQAQNPDGDWPQWFMMFERERLIRAGDSHGDVVLWPLVVVAQYLMASDDAAVLDEPVPFFDARGPGAGEHASVWQHVERALALVQRRTVPGSSLAAYGHGDWNDSLQPADPRLREHMCSAWTVTLQVQALRALAQALRHVGRDSARAAQLAALADAVQADFQRLLIADGVLSGYAVFENHGDGAPRYLLHPRDQQTGVQYSALGMIHAILEDLFTPAQARAHLRLLEERLSGPDGVRLFDLPLPYHGGPQRLFQRAESATFFGREIGLMYTHAHLRYAQALAHLGEAERFLQALSQVVPIEVQSLIPSAARRQANCYFSSSDAAFADRYEARDHYRRVHTGAVALDGGWRVYSSGAGIAVGLILRRFLGWELRRDALRLDPVIPASLDGLRSALPLWDRTVEVRYRIGASGCGVQTLRLNGQAVPFAREPHAHRAGAVLAGREPLQALLRAAGNELEMELG